MQCNNSPGTGPISRNRSSRKTPDSQCQPNSVATTSRPILMMQLWQQWRWWWWRQRGWLGTICSHFRTIDFNSILYLLLCIFYFYDAHYCSVGCDPIGRRFDVFNATTWHGITMDNDAMIRTDKQKIMKMSLRLSQRLLKCLLVASQCTPWRSANC